MLQDITVQSTRYSIFFQEATRIQETERTAVTRSYEHPDPVENRNHAAKACSFFFLFFVRRERAGLGQRFSDVYNERKIHVALYI